MLNDLAFDTDPFDVVLDRAALRWTDGVRKLVDSAVHPCGKVIVLHRLMLRRLSLRAPREGEVYDADDGAAWLSWEWLQMRVDGTLDNLPADVAEALLKPCGRPTCPACSPPQICPRCGGRMAPAPVAPC